MDVFSDDECAKLVSTSCKFFVDKVDYSQQSGVVVFSAGDNQQWIADNKLSIAALTETWHDDAASPDLIACAPAGLKFVEKARARTNELSTLT